MNVLSARSIKALQSRQASSKDERIKLTGEVLQGIKAIKLSAWEDAFARRITDVRKKEIRCFKVNVSLTF